jgi:hypothetical protein
MERQIAAEGLLPSLRRSALRLIREGKTDLTAISKVIDMTYSDV